MNGLEMFGLIRDSIVMFIAFIGLLYIPKQIGEARKARLLDAYLKFENRLKNQREDRKYIYENEWTGENLPDDKRQIFERVAVTFDILGVLVREDVIYHPLVFKPYYDVIIKTWIKLEEQIKFERSRKSETYMADFFYLYNMAEKYRQKKRFNAVQVH